MTSDFITVLRSNRIHTKMVIRQKDGTFRVDPAEHSDLYSGDEIPVSSLCDIYDLLQDQLLLDPHSFAVRGKIKGGKELIKRSARDGGGLERAAHKWLALDIDDLPYAGDPTNLLACYDVAARILPAEFQGVQCILQASGSHGVKAGARLRLWFWLSKEVSDDELKSWLEDFPVDHKVFEVQQPIYTAAPKFIAGISDHMPSRLLLVDGDDAVIVPYIVYNAKGKVTGDYTGEDLAPSFTDIQSALATIKPCRYDAEATTTADWNKISDVIGGAMSAWPDRGAVRDLLWDWLEPTGTDPSYFDLRCDAINGSPYSAGWGILCKAARSANPNWHSPSEQKLGWVSTAAEDEFDCEAIGEPKKKESKPDAEWNDDLQFDAKTGKIQRLLTNVKIILTRHPEWAGIIGFDEFAQRIMILQPPPYETAKQAPFMLDDSDLLAIRIWVEERVTFDIGKDLTNEGVQAAAFTNRFHPVRNYLNALAWDGTPRLDTWLIDFLGVTDTPLHRAYAAKWMISAVKRIFEPGCKADSVLVLEGPQDIGKSLALETLTTNKAWYTDHISDIGSKDSRQELHGKWVVEHAEFDRLGKAEAGRAKAFITTTTDSFRVPYGRTIQPFPRQCVFAVTINPGGDAGQYLTDESGNRRYWAVTCAETWTDQNLVDFKALCAARDQLWGEALHRYRMDETLYLPDDLKAVARESIAARVQEDAWQDVIANFLKAKTKTTAYEILKECIRLDNKDIDTYKRKRVGRALSMLKWTYKPIWLNNKTTRGWIAPSGWIVDKGGDDNVVQLKRADADADFEVLSENEDMGALLG
jgi:predicted P-loop ATPase